MVAVSLRQRLVGAHATQGVLGNYPPPSECLVVSHIFRWARFVLPTRPVLVRPTRLAPGSGSQPLGVQLVDAHESQVSLSTYSGRETVYQFGAFEQRHIGSRSSHTLTCVTDSSCVHVHSHLALDGMCLLLARVPTVSFTSVLPILWVRTLRTLYSLLEGIYHHRKLGQVREELVEGAAVLTTRVRHAHSVLASLGQHRYSATQQARHGTVGSSKQEAEYLMSGVEPQP